MSTIFSTPAKPLIQAASPTQLRADSSQQPEVKERFADYKALVLAHVKSHPEDMGGPEPKVLRLLRPFLLSTEVSAETSPKKGRGKGKKKSMAEHGTTFGWGKPVPGRGDMLADYQTYRYTGEYIVGSFGSSNVLPTFSSFFFTVGSLADIVPLTNVFDEYRITRIDVWVTSNVLDSSTNTSGLLYTVIDYDDSSTLTAITDAEQYANVCFSSTNEGQYRSFVPSASVAMYSGVFTSFGNVRQPWIDALSTGVQHYGLKCACSITANTCTFTIQCRLHTEWRNQH